MGEPRRLHVRHDDRGRRRAGSRPHALDLVQEREPRDVARWARGGLLARPRHGAGRGERRAVHQHGAGRGGARRRDRRPRRRSAPDRTGRREPRAAALRSRPRVHPDRTPRGRTLMAIVRYVLAKLKPGVSREDYERFEREVDYAVCKRITTIVYYSTHRISEVGERLAPAGRDYIERIEVADRVACEEDLPAAGKARMDE